MADRYLLLVHDRAIKIYDILSELSLFQVIETRRNPHISVCGSLFLVKQANLFHLYRLTSGAFTVTGNISRS